MIGKRFEEIVKKYPRKIAIFDSKRKLRYREFNNMINKFTNFMVAKGLKQGDHIAIFMKNKLEYTVTIFACAKLGVAFVPINYMLTFTEISYIIKNSKSKLIISEKKFLEESDIKLDTLNIDIWSIDDQGNDFLKVMDSYSSELTVLNQIKPDDIFCLIYTSGTEGLPKGVMLTHKNLLSNADAIIISTRITTKDRILCILPLYHSYPMTTCLISPLMAGASCVLIEKIRPFSNVIKTIIRRRVSWMVGIPVLFKLLANAKVPKLLLLLMPIKVYVSGAAPLSIHTIEKFKRIFRKTICEGYGLTEASPVVSLNPFGGKVKPGSVGLPLPGVQVKIVNQEECELKPNEVGEIIVKGDNIMKGYFENEEQTVKAIRNGWLFTGDIGKLDEEGYLYIVDRKKDLIIRHAVNIYPSEIEFVLMESGFFDSVCVIGYRLEKDQEIPVAFLVTKENTTIDQSKVRQYCKEKIATYKMPHKYVFVKELPITPTGKVLKRKVKQNFINGVYGKV